MRAALTGQLLDDSTSAPITFRGHAFEPQRSICPAAVDGYAFGPAGFTLYLRSGAFFIVPPAETQAFIDTFTQLYGAEYLIPREREIQPTLSPTQMVDPLGYDFSTHLPLQR